MSVVSLVFMGLCVLRMDNVARIAGSSFLFGGFREESAFLAVLIHVGHHGMGARLVALGLPHHLGLQLAGRAGDGGAHLAVAHGLVMGLDRHVRECLALRADISHGLSRLQFLELGFLAK